MHKDIDILLLRLSPFRHGTPPPPVDPRTIATIQSTGIVEPLVCRPTGRLMPQRYEVLLGVASFAAAQRAGLERVPAWIREDLSDEEARQLVESELDPNPIHIARAAQALIDNGCTVSEVAQRMGKHRTAIWQLLALLELPDVVQAVFSSGRLSPSHARWLSGLEESNQIEIATAAVAQRLSVRDVEALAKEQRTRRPGIPVHVTAPGRARGGKDPDIRRLENEISARLGVSVVIDHRRAGGGTLRVRYPDLDVLDDLLERLGHRPDTLAERP